MLFRKAPLAPCPACAAKDVHIASLERQLVLVSERLYSLPQQATPQEPEAAEPLQPEDEPLSQTVANAIGRRASAGTTLWTELEEQARLYLAEEMNEDEIARRILTGDWEGVESADLNAEAMR
jgi:hypothetical protein